MIAYLIDGYSQGRVMRCDSPVWDVLAPMPTNFYWRPEAVVTRETYYLVEEFDLLFGGEHMRLAIMSCASTPEFRSMQFELFAEEYTMLNVLVVIEKWRLGL